jgi:hypothetical protein
VVAPLEERLADVPAPSEGGRITFVLVVTSQLAAWDRAIGLVRLGA